MRRVSALTIAPLLAALLVSACAPAGSPAAGDPAAAGEPAVEGEPAVGAEAWRTTPLRDVRSGETFAIDDLRGKLVVIELMAIWCVNCGIQQAEAAEALERLDRTDIVYLSLDVDPNEAEADLARYADERGYDWRFAVASREVARALADAFGDQILSPPATPSIVVTPGGAVAGVSFGVRSSADLEAELAAHLP